MPKIPFDNTYVRLPTQFYAAARPTAVASPALAFFNGALASELGIEVAGASPQTLAEVFAGNRLPEGSAPVALAYAGHQFGQFVPQLGDGRAVLLGEVCCADGRRFDIQLKGAGRTPFSRGGDGRAALGPVLREYLLSEVMHAFDVPTTRALAAVRTGEMVLREVPLPGAVLTRVAGSHVRVGTFQYFAARGDTQARKTLAEYCIARHYPELAQVSDPSTRYCRFLEAVCLRQIELVARWMGLGFIHGVMNTDNVSIAGETIDYGPCAFMDHYDPDTVFSSIDRGGRYAYANQPQIAQWNMARFAETLLPLIDPDPERAVARVLPVVEAMGGCFERAWGERLAAKLGFSANTPHVAELADNLLRLMTAQRADFTCTFAALGESLRAEDAGAVFRAEFSDGDAAGVWWQAWHAAITDHAKHAVANDVPTDSAAVSGSNAGGELRESENRDAMLGVMTRLSEANASCIPRNHLVEAALDAAVAGNDLKPFTTLLEALTEHPRRDPPTPWLARPPERPDPHYRTFCGT